MGSDSIDLPCCLLPENLTHRPAATPDCLGRWPNSIFRRKTRHFAFCLSLMCYRMGAWSDRGGFFGGGWISRLGKHRVRRPRLACLVETTGPFHRLIMAPFPARTRSRSCPACVNTMRASEPPALGGWTAASETFFFSQLGYRSKRERSQALSVTLQGSPSDSRRGSAVATHR